MASTTKAPIRSLAGAAPRSAVATPASNSPARVRKRARSVCHCAPAWSQKAARRGESERLSSCASNTARRCASTSARRCCALTEIRRASRMSASSALRSFSKAARCRVTSGLSALPPAVGAGPSSPRRALRSANWVVRAATKRSACATMSLVRLLTAPSSSSLSADLGIRSDSARRLFNVTSGAAACGAAVCAPATVHSTMTTRKAAMQRITELIGRILGRRATLLGRSGEAGSGRSRDRVAAFRAPSATPDPGRSGSSSGRAAPWSGRGLSGTRPHRG